MDVQQKNTHSSRKLFVLVASGVVAVLLLGALVINAMQNSRQEAAVIKATQDNGKQKGNDDEVKKKIKALQDATSIPVQVDIDVDASRGGNTGNAPATNYTMPNNVINPYIRVSPNASQTLATNGNNIVATHNIQIVASSYGDAYVSPSMIYWRLVGGQNNPTNWFWLGGTQGVYSPVQLSTSSNVTQAQVSIVFDPVNSYQVPMLKIPAGQYATFRLVYTKPVSEIYPDTYFSEANAGFVLDGVYTYNDPTFGLSVPFNTWNGTWNWKYVPSSSKSNNINVAGENSPFLLSWNTEVINQNSTITITGVRLGSMVTINTYSNGLPLSFTKPTTNVGGGKRSFTFVPANEGIIIPQGAGLWLQVQGSNGVLSNTIGLRGN